jgi:hypothetical protein
MMVIGWHYGAFAKNVYLAGNHGGNVDECVSTDSISLLRHVYE